MALTDANKWEKDDAHLSNFYPRSYMFSDSSSLPACCWPVEYRKLKVQDWCEMCRMHVIENRQSAVQCPQQCPHWQSWYRTRMSRVLHILIPTAVCPPVKYILWTTVHKFSLQFFRQSTINYIASFTPVSISKTFTAVDNDCDSKPTWT